MTMAKKVIIAQMQQRRDTRANWEATNPILLDGELGIVKDDRNLYKVGDGVSHWNDLPYRGFDGTLAQSEGDSINAVMSQKATTEAIKNKYEVLSQKKYDDLESPEDKLYFCYEEDEEE